jgi:hypothetical protein
LGGTQQAFAITIVVGAGEIKGFHYEQFCGAFPVASRDDNQEQEESEVTPINSNYPRRKDHIQLAQCGNKLFCHILLLLVVSKMI